MLVAQSLSDNQMKVLLGTAVEIDVSTLFVSIFLTMTGFAGLFKSVGVKGFSSHALVRP